MSNAERDTPTRPDIHIAPPLIFMAGFVVGYLMDRLAVALRLVGGTASPRPVAMLGVACMIAGGTLALWGVATFRRARTSVLPFRPATAMVSDGPYRFSRNPMYVGLTLGYVGLSLALNTGWPILLLPVVLYALVRFVISREEQYLAAIFGGEYLTYRKRVRRWL